MSLNIRFGFAAVVWDKLLRGKQFGYCLPPRGSAATEIDEKRWFGGGSLTWPFSEQYKW